MTLRALGTLARGTAPHERLKQALALGEELGTPDTILCARCHLAALPGGDVPAARQALAEYAERVGWDERIESYFALWKTAQRRADLDEAHRLVLHLRDHAPEDSRGTLIRNVPLHRAVVAAREG
ncbi:MAG: hypothetical protein ACE10D_13005 [Planctomycetota bacterium]